MILKQEFEQFIFRIKISNVNWIQFQNEISYLFQLKDTESEPININSLERIRFFSSFVNNFKHFLYVDEIPLESKDYSYSPRYTSTVEKFSLYDGYRSLIKRNNKFIQNHIRNFPIPNFPIWNLKLLYMKFTNIEILEKIMFKYFPLQIFENLDGSIHSMITLVNKHEKTSKIEKLPIEISEIQKLVILNNLNNFWKKEINLSSIRPRIEPIYDLYNLFLEEKHKNLSYFTPNYKLILNFSKTTKINDIVNEKINSNTIRDYNLLLDENGSNFSKFFTSKAETRKKIYRKLFLNRYSYPKLDYGSRIVFIIKKKHNKQFQRFIEFLSNWTYHTLLFESKNKIIIYGNLFPNFFSEISLQLSQMNRIFNDLGINFEYLISNYNCKHSTLSIYKLPSSYQFLDENKTWNLDNLDINMTINNKEEFIANLEF